MLCAEAQQRRRPSRRRAGFAMTGSMASMTCAPRVRWRAAMPKTWIGPRAATKSMRLSPRESPWEVQSIFNRTWRHQTTASCTWGRLGRTRRCMLMSCARSAGAASHAVTIA